jgi:hypothetical protein
MAIKLEVQQQSNRTQTFNEAASSDGSRGFGNQIAEIANLPMENPSNAVNMILQGGKQAREQAQLISAGIDKGIQLYAAHKEAEDKVKMQEVESQMVMKKSDIQKLNSERALKGEITYAQMAEENNKALELEYSNIIENTPFNFGQARDVLRGSSEKIRASTYAEDTDRFIKINTENAKNAFTAKLSSTIELMSENPGSFQRGLAELENIKANDPMYRLNPAQFEVQIRAGVEKAAHQELTLLSKEDPAKYERMKADGTLDVYKSYINDDQFKGYDNDALHSKIANENLLLSERSKASRQVFESYALKLTNEDPKLRPTRSEILTNSVLDDGDKARLVDNIDSYNKALLEKNKEINEINTIFAETKSGITLTDSQMEKHFEMRGGNDLVNTILSNPSSATNLIEQMNKDYGGRLPKPIMRALSVNPGKDNEQSWGQVVRHISKAYPDFAKDLPNNLVDIAQIMGSKKDSEGKPISFTDASSTYQFRLDKMNSDAEAKKAFDDTGIAKDSHYKNPNTFIADNLKLTTPGVWDSNDKISEDQVPDELRMRFLSNYRKQSQLTPEMDPTDIANKALADTGYGITLIGNKRAMFNPPEKSYTAKDLDIFKSNVETYVKDKGIEKYILVPNSGANTYYMMNTTTGAPITENGVRKEFKPELPASDFVNYENDIPTSEPRRQGSKAGFVVPLRKIDVNQGQQILKGIQKQYPDTVGQYPGLLDAMWKQESGRGSGDMIGPETKYGTAKGHFQFIDSTAKEYGVKDPFDFNQSANAAARYMNDLLKKYDNDLVYALAGYNWGQGNVDKWIKKGAKFGDLPAETQDYIRSISSRIG